MSEQQRGKGIGSKMLHWKANKTGTLTGSGPTGTKAVERLRGRAVVSLKSERVAEKAPAIARVLAAAQLKKANSALKADEPRLKAGFWKYRKD